MKKFIAISLIMTMLYLTFSSVSFAAETNADNFDEVYFETDKSNYTVGTSGKINLVTITNGMKEIDKLSTSYVSSDTSVLTIENDGTFTAISVGSAQITPVVSSLSVNFEPITLNVVAQTEISSYVAKDIQDGKLSESMINGNAKDGSTLASRRHGTKLFGVAFQGQYLTGSAYLLHNTASGDPMLMAFVYKLEGELESISADTETWSPDELKKRTQIAYLTDDTITFYDTRLRTDINIKNPEVSTYGLCNFVTEKAENDAYKLNSAWIADSNITWEQTSYTNPARFMATSTNIPEGAKYAVVLLNSGKLEDGSASIHSQFLHFGGVKLVYKPQIVAGEITPDGRIAITYSGNIKNPANVVVKLNGKTVDANVTYDAATFTSYIDKSVTKKGGAVSVEVDGVGSWNTTIDTVIDVKAVGIEGEYSPLVIGQNKVDVSLNIEYSDNEKVQLFAGYYKGSKLRNVQYRCADLVNGKASVNFTLPFDEAATEEHTLRVFCWDGSLKPITNELEFKAEIPKSVLDERYGSELDKQGFDDLKISEFYNNKKAAVSVTFDDGIYSAAEYYNSLFAQYNIHGTAMMVSDWVDKAYVSKWQNLFDGGNIDLGNHSKTHKIAYNNEGVTAEMIEEDVIGGYNALKEMFPNEEIISFASPWTHTNSIVTDEVKKNHYANRCVGNNGFVSSSPTVETMMCLPSFVVRNGNTAKDLNALIDTAIANKQWFVHLLHGVGSGEYDIKKDVCAEHFAYIGSKSDDVWAGSLNEVVKYIYEKQNADVSFNWIRENALSISVTDSLDDKIFNFPLTIKVNVPSGWNTVEVIQNDASTTVTAHNEGDKNYVYINVIPDNGRVLIKNK